MTKTIVQVCGECDESDHDKGRYLTCGLKSKTNPDGTVRPIAHCEHARDMRDPAIACPHPDEGQRARYAAASREFKGCSGGVAKDRPLPVIDFVTLRVRACDGCSKTGRGWFCGELGRSVASDIKQPAAACPLGTWSAEVVH